MEKTETRGLIWARCAERLGQIRNRKYILDMATWKTVVAEKDHWGDQWAQTPGWVWMGRRVVEDVVAAQVENVNHRCTWDFWKRVRLQAFITFLAGSWWLHQWEIQQDWMPTTQHTVWYYRIIDRNTGGGFRSSGMWADCLGPNPSSFTQWTGAITTNLSFRFLTCKMGISSSTWFIRLW